MPFELARRRLSPEGNLQRTISATVMFAVAAVVATALLAAISYRGVHGALEAEFSRRIAAAAAATAAQISPEDIADARLLGEDGPGYAVLQVQLEGLRVSAGLTDASAFDSARVTLYDCQDSEAAREVTHLDTLARAEVLRALAGRPALTRAYARAGSPHRAALAPVFGGDRRVAGVVVVEARLDYLPVLERFKRTLALAALLVALAMTVLALVVARAAQTSARLERQLSRSENLAAMGRLTATLAHEIKNPLAIIRGSAQRLGRLAPEAQRMADYVVEETDRLTATVARYLQFARGETESGGTGDAALALGATLDLLEGEVHARRVTLVRPTGGPASAPVPLDNESLKQVYLNLMLNALDAMADGGTLTIAMAERGGDVEVGITDTGPGMPSELVRRLGDPFFTTKAKGSGLGLFLTRGLVQSAGGRLEIRSVLGRGTECTIRLPRVRGAGAAPASREAGSHGEDAT